MASGITRNGFFLSKKGLWHIYGNKNRCQPMIFSDYMICSQNFIKIGPDVLEEFGNKQREARILYIRYRYIKCVVTNTVKIWVLIRLFIERHKICDKRGNTYFLFSFITQVNKYFFTWLWLQIFNVARPPICVVYFIKVICNKF